MTTQTTNKQIENLLQTSDLERAQAGYLNAIAGVLEHTRRLLGKAPVIPGLEAFQAHRAEWHIEQAKVLIMDAAEQARASAIVDITTAERLQEELSKNNDDDGIPF